MTKTLLLITALLAPPLLSAASPEDLPGATVTIPYTELRALWEAAHPKETPEKVLPISSALHRANYVLDVAAGTLQASFEAENFSDEWQFLPLVSSDLKPLSTEKPKGQNPSKLVLRDKRLGLLVSAAGSAEISLTFDASALHEAQRSLRLEALPAAISSIQVIGLEDDQQLQINGKTCAESLPLAPSGGVYEMALQNREAIVEETPSDWQFSPQVLAKIGGERSEFEAHLSCQAETGSGVEMSFSLPANTTVSTLESADLVRWQSRRSEGQTRVHLRWETPGVLNREVHLHYHSNQASTEAHWQLVAPQIDAETPSLARYLLANPDGFELEGEGLAQAPAITRLPAWMRASLEDREISIAESASPIQIRATWLPTVEIADATVQQADFDLRIVEDGSMLVKADYQIDHTGRFDWQLDLPADARLLSCEVGGKAVKPIARGDDSLELPLPSSKEKTTVHLSYSARTEELDPVSGKLVLKLPQTGLFTHQLTWNITLPTTYLTTAIESNCSTGQCGGPHKIHLEKQLCHDEAPAAEIHYQKQGLN